MAMHESYQQTPRLEAIDEHELPAEVARTMWYFSGMYTASERAIPSDFLHIFRMRPEAGLTSYAAEHMKTYRTDGHTELVTYIADTNDQEEVMGFGELRYALDSPEPYIQGKPVVGWTETADDHRGQGLGQHRLRTMNQVALTLYGAPLHSDIYFSDDAAERVWKKLVREHEAEKFIETETPTGEPAVRYRFKT